MVVSRATLVAAVLTLAPGAWAQLPPANGAIATLESEQQTIFDQAAPAVVLLSGKEGFGSGFFVADGLILTNAHVVRGRDTATVVLHDGQRLEGKVIERAAGDVDLALVRVEVKSPASLALAGTDALRVGSWVASVGHGLGGVWTFTTGMVSNIYPVGAERPVIQTQVPLNPGNSGGPLLDRFGRVVGVVTAGIERASSLNFAIRADTALRALDGLRAQCGCLLVRAPAGVPVFVGGKNVGQGPRVSVPLAPGAHEVFAVVRGRMLRQALQFPATTEVDLTRELAHDEVSRQDAEPPAAGAAPRHRAPTRRPVARIPRSRTGAARGASRRLKPGVRWVRRHSPMTSERTPRPPLTLVARQADVGFYQRHASQHGGPVLVLGCANGRIPWELASAGATVVGVDPSERMIASAEERRADEKPEVSARVKLERADLRALRLSEKFPLVIAPQNALGLMQSPEDLEALIATVAHHLAPGGTFVFDLVHAPARAAGRLVEDAGHPEFVAPGRPSFSPHLDHKRREADASTRSITRLKLRPFTSDELSRALASGGLAEHERFGSFDGKPFEETDPVRISVASGV